MFLAGLALFVLVQGAAETIEELLEWLRSERMGDLVEHTVDEPVEAVGSLCFLASIIAAWRAFGCRPGRGVDRSPPPPMQNPE